MNKQLSRPLTSRKYGQRGVATMDVVVSIILLAALAGVVFYFATKGNSARAAADEASLFNVIAQDSAAKYASQGNYTGATAGVLISHGVIPPKMINGTAVISGFNTPITISPANLGGTDDGLAFTYQVPRKACSNFVTGVVADRIAVGGSTVYDETTGINKLDVTALGTACNANAGSGNVAVVLTKGR